MDLDHALLSPVVRDHRRRDGRDDGRAVINNNHTVPKKIAVRKARNTTSKMPDRKTKVKKLALKKHIPLSVAKDHKVASFLTSKDFVRSKRLTYGSDCSGYDGAAIAFELLGIDTDHVFSSEVDAKARKVLKYNHIIKRVYNDVTARDNKKTPFVDVYTAGFPCQPFSSSGKRKGFQDRRGQVGFHCTDYIKQQKPTAFVLENVVGLTQKRHIKLLNALLNDVRGVKDNKGKEFYTVRYDTLNTAEHGVPQSRPRLYIVGISKAAEKSSGQVFRFPEPLSWSMPLDSILEPAAAETAAKRRAPTSPTMLAKLHCVKAMAQKDNAKIDRSAPGRFMKPHFEMYRGAWVGNVVLHTLSARAHCFTFLLLQLHLKPYFRY